MADEHESARADDGLDLDAIAARANAATPGPWGWWCYPGPDVYLNVGRAMYQIWPSEDDAIFIAHARADVPALGNAVAALRYAAAHLYERLCDISDEWPGTIAECIPDAPDSARAAALDAWLWYSDRETRP